ncbi:Uncharacterized protein OS=Blastopirellula marina DSM 3645 GN=DSM3645_24505 PE=4 SV=1 [Gemmataceae bacterium]|nr:Uncharacterized protein OS=Blastopirellula marina DSM 3645 GN=DSM3645_24505 PE=4 SV=1 [Gemmataceae bacterium]VTT97956.1 Uncharacterized protein OS=Blastopirellula marina DSM 3645 GN=DSM3645_24505 PE=4 SV=1 [Gemmataceae bacterium]
MGCDPGHYPKRPDHFSHKFCRLMGKVCLGADIGPEACWLLAYIVNTEDAAHYRRPVSFFNEDLSQRTGLSLANMKRIRDKAVEAGWLWYEPGAKGRAARYYVTVPAWADGLDDGPGDERAGSLSGRIPAQPEPESDQKDGIPAGCRLSLSQNPSGMRTECEPHSTLSLSLNTYTPAESGNHLAEPELETKSHTAPERKRPTPDADPQFAEFWAAYPHKVDKPAALKSWAKLKVSEELLQTILAGLERYKSRKPAWQEWKHPGPWLNARRWEDEPSGAPPPPVPNAIPSMSEVRKSEQATEGVIYPHPRSLANGTR